MTQRQYKTALIGAPLKIQIRQDYSLQDYKFNDSAASANRKCASLPHLSKINEVVSES